MGFVIHWLNQPWIYMCSPSRSPLPPPSPSHPSGSSQCTSPEHLSHASNLGWWSVSPLIIYMFRCYSLKTSHKYNSLTSAFIVHSLTFVFPRKLKALDGSDYVSPVYHYLFDSWPRRLNLRRLHKYLLNEWMDDEWGKFFTVWILCIDHGLLEWESKKSMYMCISSHFKCDVFL